jgi:UPF0271 protein
MPPVILDSAAFMSDAAIPRDKELFTIDDVVVELKDAKSTAKLSYLKSVGLRILAPSDKSIDSVKEVARKTGDIEVLSNPDIKILALAQDVGGTIVTDDYAVQNVAAAMNITYQGAAQKGITEKINWVFRCKGCGRIWTRCYDECPVCGTALKRVPEKKKRKAKQKYNKANTE